MAGSDTKNSARRVDCKRNAATELLRFASSQTFLGPRFVRAHCFIDRALSGHDLQPCRRWPNKGALYSRSALNTQSSEPEPRITVEERPYQGCESAPENLRDFSPCFTSACPLHIRLQIAADSPKLHTSLFRKPLFLLRKLAGSPTLLWPPDCSSPYESAQGLTLSPALLRSPKLETSLRYR